MKFAFFPGCKLHYHLRSYEWSLKQVLTLLNVELIQLEFNCCGNPLREKDFTAFIYSAARNMALAHKKGLNILTPCKCCLGNLKHAAHFLAGNKDLQNEINAMLKKEGLFWSHETQVKHLLTVLYHDVGLDAIASRIKKPYHDLKIAAHYGCHALRPGNIMQFDNPLSPRIFEDLIKITGAQPVDWSRRLECCGNPLWEKNPAMSLRMMQQKLEDACQSGADFLCTACTYCQIQFDEIRAEALNQKLNTKAPPAILYSQLLGLSLGIDSSLLGLEMNKIDILPVLNYLSQVA